MGVLADRPVEPIPGDAETAAALFACARAGARLSGAGCANAWRARNLGLSPSGAPIRQTYADTLSPCRDCAAGAARAELLGQGAGGPAVPSDPYAWLDELRPPQPGAAPTPPVEASPHLLSAPAPGASPVGSGRAELTAAEVLRRRHPGAAVQVTLGGRSAEATVEGLALRLRRYQAAWEASAGAEGCSPMCARRPDPDEALDAVTRLARMHQAPTATPSARVAAGGGPAPAATSAEPTPPSLPAALQLAAPPHQVEVAEPASAPGEPERVQVFSAFGRVGADGAPPPATAVRPAAASTGPTAGAAELPPQRESTSPPSSRIGVEMPTPKAAPSAPVHAERGDATSTPATPNPPASPGDDRAALVTRAKALGLTVGNHKVATLARMVAEAELASGAGLPPKVAEFMQRQQLAEVTNTAPPSPVDEIEQELRAHLGLEPCAPPAEQRFEPTRPRATLRRPRAARAPVAAPVTDEAVIDVRRSGELELDATDTRALAERAARPHLQAAEVALAALLDAEEHLAVSRLGKGHTAESVVQLLVARLDLGMREVLERYHRALVSKVA